MVIRRHDMTLIWLNFAFLLFIELQPIINSLRVSYPASQTTAILYASEQVATGLMLLVISNLTFWLILLFPVWVLVISVCILIAALRSEQAEAAGMVGSPDLGKDQ